MSRFFTFAPVLVFALVLAGCSSAETPPQAPVDNTPGQVVENPQTPEAPIVIVPDPEQPQAPTEPEPIAADQWAFKYAATCAAERGDQCVGAYGFTVDLSGKYQVGPGPRSQVKAGKLTEAELATLQALIPAEWRNEHAQIVVPAGLTDTCAAALQKDSTASITFQLNGSELILAKAQGKELCSPLAQEKAVAVHDALAALAEAHYRLPFGDDCGDTILDLEGTYDAAAECQSDADCTYIDYNFNPISNGILGNVVARDCSLVPVLFVGNAAKVVETSQPLIKSYNKVWETCGNDRLAVAECSEWKEFQSSVGAPTCVANRCQAHPAAAAQ